MVDAKSGWVRIASRNAVDARMRADDESLLMPQGESARRIPEASSIAVDATRHMAPWTADMSVEIWPSDAVMALMDDVWRSPAYLRAK
jgi:hypothetical protein